MREPDRPQDAPLVRKAFRQKMGDDAWGPTRELLRNTIEIIKLAGPNVRQLFRAEALGMTPAQPPVA